MIETLGDAPVLGELDPAAVTGFTRRSAIRRLAAEPIVALFLFRALTMQVAHAKVGAGVADHSEFQTRPLNRAWSTMDVGIRLVWGDPQVARAAARQVYAFHDHVNGRVPEDGPAWSAGAPYTAHDSSLLLWVWATLVEWIETANDRYVGSLTEADRDDFYADMCTFARFFGLPESVIPPHRLAFRNYFERVMDGEQLMPTKTSAEVIRRVLWFHSPLIPGFATRVPRVLAIGTLDQRLRERYGLTLSSADQRLFGLVDGTLRRVYRHRPDWLVRAMPPLYVALRRPMLAATRRPPTGK